MAGDANGYPKRPSHFAHKFCRLLLKACVANELGADACWLLSVIAHTEDARGYRGPVTFWNGQLFPLIGLGSESAFRRLREKCIEAGWLVHRPGAKGKAPAYWVEIPAGYADWDDGPTDESATGFPPDSHRIPTAFEQESGGNVNKKAVGKRWESEQHSSLTLPLEEKTPSESCVASATPAATATTAKPKPKEPTGPHAEAVAAFVDAWAAKYGDKYFFNGGKDAKAVKQMLGHCGGDVGKFRGVVARYLADADPFVADKRHPLGLLLNQFSKWQVASPPQQARPPTPGPRRVSPKLMNPEQAPTWEELDVINKRLAEERQRQRDKEFEERQRCNLQP